MNRQTGIRLIIRMEPAPKLRTRIAITSGKVRTYTPTKTQVAERELAEYFKKHKDKAFPAGVPLKLSIVFYRAKPPSCRKYVMPVHRPDLDNFCKLVCDALNGVLVADDAQICTMLVRKRWSENGKGYMTLRLEEDKAQEVLERKG